jgi:hypothetical protein
MIGGGLGVRNRFPVAKNGSVHLAFLAFTRPYHAGDPGRHGPISHLGKWNRIAIKQGG